MRGSRRIAVAALRSHTDNILVYRTGNDKVQGVKEIKRAHRAKGLLDIGFHFVIRTSGEIEVGRPLGQIGAHCKGKNRNSVAICLVCGEPNCLQIESLTNLTKRLQDIYPNATLKAPEWLPKETE